MRSGASSSSDGCRAPGLFYLLILIIVSCHVFFLYNGFHGLLFRFVHLEQDADDVLYKTLSGAELSVNLPVNGLRTAARWREGGGGGRKEGGGGGGRLEVFAVSVPACGCSVSTTV